MMIKLFSQLILASTLFQFFPTDAARIEVRAGLSSSSPQTFDIFETMNRLEHRLPLAPNRPQPPKKIRPLSLGVETTAQSAIVVDRASKEILFEKNIHEPRSIGSITKLMTARVFLEGNPDLDAPAIILGEDVRLGAVLHLPVGEQIRIRDILAASLIGSDNTATSALARLSGLPEGDFIARMNEVAAEIGMQQTTFDDTTGLSPRNRSVVMDIVLMLDAVMTDQTIRELTQQSTIVIQGASGRSYTIKSTDELLTTFVNRTPYAIVGAKTGFLPEAGYCLGTIFSHESGGESIVVVLGSDSKEGRFQDVKSLGVWTYETFDWDAL